MVHHCREPPAAILRGQSRHPISAHFCFVGSSNQIFPVSSA
jgi:hypothetical protein